MEEGRVQTAAAGQLRAAGLKVTPARLRVLAQLTAAVAPLCHGELERRLAAEAGGAIDRVTLYRVLDSLAGHGLAVRSVDDQGLFRYATVAERQRHQGHAHFRCTGCGSVFCLDAPPPPPPRLPRGFRPAEVELDVRGTCADCARSPGAAR
jgi:Fur family ferric uptake transcriptional regulator